MKPKTYISIFIIILILISAILIINNKNNKSSLYANSTSISNSKIEWGIKRSNNHIQPDLGKKNEELISKYNGICMGNKDKPYVYLTFDAGYEAGYTENILKTLKENQVNATFFITGHYLNSQTDLVRKMIDEGHIVGNHTVNHKSMPSLTDDELKLEVMNFHKAIYEKLDYEMKYIRPPKGEYSQRTLELSNSLGYTTVMWSLAYDDWDEKKQGRQEYGKKKILDNIHNGAVILLHSTSKDNMEILDDVIKQTKNMGYEFKSLNEFEK